uniref:DVU3141 family protein n=1 Tax=Marinobacterium profundum TaxID=1714300 RepID=UPI00083036F5|nr:DVU3141 family protein [Marinobacterium profundum]
MHRNIENFAKLSVAALAVVVLAGCSAWGGGNESAYAGSVSPASKGQALSAEVSAFLAQSAEFSSRSFPNSYWGESVDVTASARYFAASGRYCREVAIDTATGTQSGRWLTCETSSGQWAAVRPLGRTLVAQ